ncbi:MAG TPA: bifunctional DNA-formamidopyrimidine glycosylase/DNA-(apurinic or apyrimidinic site) lyase [Candidatus Babeliales bacterium]|nr:bifunctional DNA-formamidopyrimidine glycosylase/DNA-(apurinic or apyrimidinic site) lyase [Candidatus Babeliales bacterium]
MPELPEVETVVRNLRPVLVNSIINNITVLKTKIVSPDLRTQVINQKILAVERRGKYIIIKLTVGYLVVHLRMTGKLFTVTESEFSAAQQRYKHLHVIFDLVGDNFLLFVDQRQFGRINYCEDLAWLHEKLGIDPWDNNFTVDWLKHKFSQIKRAAKPVLLDQSMIAGLGNIYVDEALWHAGVHPKRPVNQITESELERLYTGIRTTLELAIAKNGTTFQSYSFMGEKSGEFVSYLKVFGRQNLACDTCSTKIIKIRVAQRGTHICPACQAE